MPRVGQVRSGRTRNSTCVDVEPEPVGGDLGERGPGALAHVVRAGLHHAGAVAADAPRGPPPGTSAPGTSPCPCPSRRAGRRRRASAGARAAGRDQPKRSAPCGVAFAQRLRGERLAGDRLDLGVVLQPERERIHAAGLRHLVDGALQRDRARRLARRAHEQRRAGVEPHRVVRCRDRRARIERMRDVGGGLEEVVEACSTPSWRDGRCSASARRRRPRRCRSVCRVGARWPTGPYICSRRSTSLTGLADEARRQDAEHLRPGHEALGAEAAAEERAADVDVLRAGCRTSPASAPLRHGEALARRVDGQRVAVPCGHDRVRLHRVVVLRRRLVGRVDPPRGRRRGRPRHRLRCASAGVADAHARAARSSRRRRDRCGPARPRSAARAARRLRSRPPASRR